MPRRAVILGTGKIASGIALALARNGLAVAGVNRSGAAGDSFSEVHHWGDLDRALDGCDLLVAALPAARSTDAIVDQRVLGSLRSAQFVNVGRGRTVDLSALRRALSDGCVVHADLDVFSPEPPEVSSWLWSHPSVRITPHVAALTTVDEVVEAIVSTHGDLSRGVPPRLQVHPQLLDLSAVN